MISGLRVLSVSPGKALILIRPTLCLHVSAAGERAQRGWLHFYPRQESTKFTFTIGGLAARLGGAEILINCDVFNPRTCLGCQTGVETAIAASGPFLGLCSPEFLWLKALAGGPLHKDPPYPRPTFTIVQSFTGSCANFYHFTFDSYRRATTHRIHVGRNLRTGSVCKLRLPVCRLNVFNVQFVDCTRHKPGLQTGIHVCKPRQPSFQTGKKSVSWFESADGILKETNFLTTHATRSMAENAEQKRLFTEALQKQCGDGGQGAYAVPYGAQV